MALRNLINSNVDSAFRLIGDLGTTVSFTNADTTGYDFSDGSTTTTTETAVSITGIVGSTRRDAGTSSINTTITFKSNDVSVVSSYDTATFNSSTWNVVSFEDDGYLTVVNVSRSI